MILIPCWISAFWRGREVSRPYHAKSFWEIGRFDSAFFQEIILSFGVFRRETASGFYPWGKVEGSRERVAEGLCGWRHGNSFPMTQSAQSHRQMWSIPHCPKAVFYVFVFDSIHNSATMHNLSPGFFHWSDSIGVKKSTQKNSCEICANLWLIFNHEFHKSHE